jgi:hypothetical protein
MKPAPGLHRNMKKSNKGATNKHHYIWVGSRTYLINGFLNDTGIIPFHQRFAIL